MLINEVCKRCGLTKKAIEYYEEQGLTRPQIYDQLRAFFTKFIFTIARYDDFLKVDLKEYLKSAILTSKLGW